MMRNKTSWFRSVAKGCAGLYNQTSAIVAPSFFYPTPMPFVQLREHRVFYQSQGQGPPVILLHNATGSTRDWRYLMPRLADAGYWAIAYDRPGFGRSDPLARWPLDYLHSDRDDLIALMDALGLEQAALLGNSDGAAISLLTAAAFPQRVILVVAESPHMWYEREHLAQGFQQFQETLGQDPRFIKAMRRAHGRQAHAVIRRWRERWLDPAFAAWDDSAALDRIRHIPVLVIHGRRDTFFPLSHSQKIVSRLDNATLAVVDAGHTPHREMPEAYARLVIQFIDANRDEYEHAFFPK